MRTLNPWLTAGRDRGVQIAPFAELQRINRRASLNREWANRLRNAGGKRFLTTENIAYGTYTAMTVTNLQSLANDATDTFAGWQSARVDNQTTTKASDYEIQILLSTAATAPANDQSVYVYLVPWIYDGAAWTPAANFGTVTRPTGSEATAVISEPNSMKGPIVLPYKITSQPIDGLFTVSQMCGPTMPDGWSLALRNCTGAALGTGCVVAYRPVTYTDT